MKEIQNPKELQIQKKENQLPVDLEVFKSMYYWLNAKPDTHIKISNDERIVNINDIYRLNERIVEKLNTENIEGSITTIDIIFDKSEAKSFGTYAQFLNTNLEIPEKTESVQLKWDISIKLPHYELPQRHTLKVRLGTMVRPNELFQLMSNSDDDIELFESFGSMVAKVDFINTVISYELLNIIERWWSTLPKNVEKGAYIKFIEKNKEIINFSIRMIITLAVLIGIYRGFEWLIISRDLRMEGTTGSKFVICSVLSLAFLLGILNFISSMSGRYLRKKIDGFSTYPMFLITLGDKNAKKEVDDKNKTLSRQITIRATIALVIMILSFFLNKIL